MQKIVVGGVRVGGVRVGGAKVGGIWGMVSNYGGKQGLGY